MNKVRCKHCGDYSNKEDCKSVGLSYFCNEDHFYKHKLGASKSRKPIKQKPIKKKSKAKHPMPEGVRSQVLQRDWFRCMICKEPLSVEAAEVHHIRYKSETGGSPDHSPENLATLCRSCHHDKVHGDKAYWQPVLLWAVAVRERDFG